MKKISRLPLYLGLSVLVLSVLVTSVTVGQKRNVALQRSQASATTANLSLQFTSPRTVSILINSPVDVSGIDIVIKYDKDKFTILPSSLSSGDQFITTGGKLNKGNGTFSFSAISKSGVKNTIAATFSVRSLTPKIATSGNLAFETGQDKTVVLDKSSGQNILGNAEGVNLTIPAQ